MFSSRVGCLAFVPPLSNLHSIVKRHENCNRIIQIEGDLDVFLNRPLIWIKTEVSVCNYIDFPPNYTSPIPSNKLDPRT